MVSYTCPLCCSAIFSTLNALKIHLVNAAERLCCPLCKSRQADIRELIVHLDKNACQPAPTVKVESVGSNDRSILEKALLASVLEKPAPEHRTPVTVEEEQQNVEEVATVEEEEGMYTCQMCNITFNSIEEHLRKYHEGEEVLVETDNPSDIEKTFNLQPEEGTSSTQALTNDTGNEDSAAAEKAIKLDPDGDDPLDEDYVMEDEEEEEEEDDIGDDEEDDMESEKDVQPVKFVKMPIMNSKRQTTIEEKECVDKEGRPYTRKVVKIDKFWKRVEEDAVVENFLYQDGKIKKLTDEGLTQVDENAEILQVFHCKHCKLSFGEEATFIKHECKPRPKKAGQLAKPKSQKTQYKCRYCAVTCTSISALQTHTASHIKKETTTAGANNKVITLGPYLCTVCQTKLPSFKSLRLHSRMHDNLYLKPSERPVPVAAAGDNVQLVDGVQVIKEMFLCPVCKSTFSKEFEEVHMRSHSDGAQHICTICNRHFDTAENLSLHAKAHRNEKKYVCSYCKKQFLSYSLFKQHVDTICRKRAYECQYCGRRFSRPHEKVKHERIHTGEKPHVCNICGKSFRVSYCLTLHMRTHSGTRPYHCTVCGKRFKSHSVYNHHQLTHSDVRAYKCPYCPKAFKTSVQLAGHKNSHTKPFTCTECNRPFASLYAVRVHMETHKRENNLKYDCWLCGASYARAFALRDHMKSQHEETIVGLPDEEGGDGGVVVAMAVTAEEAAAGEQLGEAINSIVEEGEGEQQEGEEQEISIEQEFVGVEEMEVVHQQEISV